MNELLIFYQFKNKEDADYFEKLVREAFEKVSNHKMEEVQ